MDYLSLSSMQMDALKEVANIGAGNAATALSQLLNRRIEMTVPSVKLIDFQEMLAETSEREVVGIMVRVLGDAPGYILFLFEKEEALNVVAQLTGEEDCEISDLGASALNEVGNIVSSSHMNAIGKLTNLLLIPSVPALSQDMYLAMISTLIIEAAQFGDSILEVETIFNGITKKDNEQGVKNERLSGAFFFVPRPGSLEKILYSLGMN